VVVVVVRRDNGITRPRIIGRRARELSKRIDSARERNYGVAGGEETSRGQTHTRVTVSGRSGGPRVIVSAEAVVSEVAKAAIVSRPFVRGRRR